MNSLLAKYSGKKILITGHTGFKGSWLSLWLQAISADVIGYALAAPTNPSLFDIADVEAGMTSIIADIRDLDKLHAVFAKHQPEIVIHMAAQPLVLESYENPRETFDVNVMGTANLLDLAFKKDYVEAVVIVTTDKVYRNDNSGSAFIETDPLEGKDPYSASKVGAEAVVAAWQQIGKIKGGPKDLKKKETNYGLNAGHTTRQIQSSDPAPAPVQTAHKANASLS